ncbi:B-cell receptor CD22-like [Stegastes partitus]|uniref:B-cell receptor CD22-like n=1 Tax=Stegastes partitus TaxID=144197 RepID=A0A9Y4KLH0_9TELE|nr:PREDICTED: B-cell receptor CD22-like [Stegastes partitus]
MKWYTAHGDDYKIGQHEISPDGDRVAYNMSKENNSTLTIKDLRESDENIYCCSDNAINPVFCWHTGTKLHLADLQVKVIPSTEGQTVTLMCSTSCPLTENPAAYIWYKNGEFVYEDWSPWYQELVSSEEAVRYSCAVKGYEDVRAPEVSVGSVTAACFSVTYAKGRMCSHKLTSVDESCSVTYPREVHVERVPAEGYLILTCATSCTQTDPLIAYRWYHNGRLYSHTEHQQLEISRDSSRRASCAVRDNEDLLSYEVYIGEKNRWRVNYVSRRICTLEGSSVNISSEYLHPDNQPPKFKRWYKIKRGGTKEADILTEAAGRVEYHDDTKNRHILTIKKLRRDDSAEYAFRLQNENVEWKHSDLPGVTLVTTGLTVTMIPSAEVTEGQRVTLTCSTSCPLTDNTNYMWYFNGRPLGQNKHLLLDPVSVQHAGNYSCAVNTHENMTSAEEALIVRDTLVEEEELSPGHDSCD